ncbi:MAG: hypothetical protein CME64_06605 [Halobacteriovoraceae bacterium]|nr:hypothetical protein [Halobacteriovoraceae bacterium]|tara:strand:- start:30791 stop:32164 length:1374 start_codon:yes stop_codon:yes gene_type:complete
MQTQSALNLIKTLSFADSVFIVGGALRDEHLGMEIKDIDLVSFGKNSGLNTAKALKTLFKDSITGPFSVGDPPVIKLRFKEDIVYRNKVFSCKDIEIDITQAQGKLIEDIKRRDFTINMLAFDLKEKELLDPSGRALQDLEARTLRTLPETSPSVTFKDDPVRLIRLARFASVMNFSISENIKSSTKELSGLLEGAPGERLQSEIEKVCIKGRLSKFVKILDELGLLRKVLPEVSDLKGVEQDVYYHSEGDVFTHTLLVVKNSPKGVIPQLSALLHDIGKPSTQEFFPVKNSPPRIKFIGHEKVGEEIAGSILKRLRYDNRTISKVKKLVKNHLRPLNANDWSPKALRKFSRELGEDAMNCLDLAEADILSSYDKEGKIRVNPIPRIRKELKDLTPTINTSPILTGKEIIEALSIEKGPLIGEIKKKLIEWEDEQVLEGKEITKSSAVDFLKSYLKM